MSLPNQASISPVKRREKAEIFLQRFTKCKNQGNSILEIADKAKIEGDKLPKVTNSLAKSLNRWDSPAIDRMTTKVKVFEASGASASLPGWCEEAMDLSFGEMKRVKTLVSSKDSKEGRYGSIGDSLKENKIFI